MSAHSNASADVINAIFSFFSQLMDHLCYGSMSAPWALSCPSQKTYTLWPSFTKKLANRCPTTQHALTVGPMHWVHWPCPLAATAGWWMWARVVPLRSGSATPLWSAKALETRPDWAITLSLGCCLTTTGTTPSATLGRRCPCRWWGNPRGSACCWTGRARRCCFMRRTPATCCTLSHMTSAPRCCRRLPWRTAASPYCIDTKPKTRNDHKREEMPLSNVNMISS